MKTVEQYIDEYIDYLIDLSEDEIIGQIEESKRDFKAGFNLAKELYEPKWISVKEGLPNTDQQHSNNYESEWVLLDLGDTFKVSRYSRTYSNNGKNLLYELWLYIEDQKIVERWMTIQK